MMLNFRSEINSTGRNTKDISHKYLRESVELNQGTAMAPPCMRETKRQFGCASAVADQALSLNFGM